MTEKQLIDFIQEAYANNIRDFICVASKLREKFPEVRYCGIQPEQSGYTLKETLSTQHNSVAVLTDEGWLGVHTPFDVIYGAANRHFFECADGVNSLVSARHIKLPRFYQHPEINKFVTCQTEKGYLGLSPQKKKTPEPTKESLREDLHTNKPSKPAKTWKKLSAVEIYHADCALRGLKHIHFKELPPEEQQRYRDASALHNKMWSSDAISVEKTETMRH